MSKPKPNEGDIMEGMFALALGLYIAEGKVDITKLRKLRTKIDPQKFISDSVKIEVAKNVKRKSGNFPADIFDVNVTLRLKTSVVDIAFGDEFREKYYDKLKDYGDLESKTNQIARTVGNSAWSKEVDKVVNKFLQNNKKEKALFEVVADGIEGEKSGGLIKGDVNLTVYAIIKKRKVLIKGGKMAFSLKSDSQTVANLSPYHGMVSIAKHLQLKWNGIDGLAERYKGLMEKAKTPAEKKQKFIWIRKMYKDLTEELIVKAKKDKKIFTKLALEFLSENMFGTDLALVVDIRKNKLKEINPKDFNVIKEKAILTLKKKSSNVGGQLIFHDETTKTDLFQLRLRAEESRNFGKFYLEIKPGLYSKQNN